MIFAFVIANCFAQTALADAEREEPTTTQVAVGFVELAMQTPYRDAPRRTIPLPFLIYNSDWLNVCGPAANLNLPSLGTLAFSLTAELSFDGFKASDASRLAGLFSRDDKLWMGASSSWRLPQLTVSAEWSSDVSGISRGRKLRLSIEHAFNLGRLTLIPRMGIVSLDRNYVDYYYGVRAAEVKLDRPGYAPPRGTINREIGVAAGYRMTSKGSLFMNSGVQRIGGEIRRSPLASRSSQNQILFGYIHLF